MWGEVFDYWDLPYRGAYGRDADTTLRYRRLHLLQLVIGEIQNISVPYAAKFEMAD